MTHSPRGNRQVGPLLPRWSPPSDRLPIFLLPLRGRLWLPEHRVTIGRRNFETQRNVNAQSSKSRDLRQRLCLPQALNEEMWEGRGLKKENEEEKSHVLGEGSPQEREPGCALEGSEGWGEGQADRLGSKEL